MNENHIINIAKEHNLTSQQVRGTAALIEDGATVPFIARYRKEATGSLDEVAIMSIRDRMSQLQELDKRRESILKSLLERELLTEDLKAKINSAESLSALEDIYLPYRPKRRTRATIAREKGLEPLAKMIFSQHDETDPQSEAEDFINLEKGVTSVEEALSGCRDIIAEWVNEDQEARGKMRALYGRKAVFRCKVIPGKEEEGSKFRDYFDWEETVAKAPSHRILAMRRGEKEGFLDLRVDVPEDDATAQLEALFIKGENRSSEEVKASIQDCFKRLLSPSMETEVRMESKKRADKAAISIFAGNLRERLLESPLGQKNMLAIDPGIRTGGKVVFLDRQGKLLETDTIHIFRSEKEKGNSAERIISLCKKYNVEAIAIGNGTGGRETESFVRNLSLKDNILIVSVNESGASVYSASAVARAEFPDLDVSLRGAVSIGRRLMDPLAELVKIEPKSIGVGQYQHDVNQKALKQSLDDVVMSCVNGVGVELNTASEQLLTYVSGFGPELARNVISHRNEFGAFVSRKELKKVPRLGPKAFEQAAGFLRIRNAKNPLDASAVHPESYTIVKNMAKEVGCEVKDLMEDQSLRGKVDLQDYVTDKVGMPTLTDILAELAKPGRDPRKKFEEFSFAEGIEKLEDLQLGMKLSGVVTNVTAFGAFVDIGVHQDGLVHISQLKDGFVKDPNDVVKVNQHVSVSVLDVDLERNRISLSMRNNPEKSPSKSRKTKTMPKKKSNKQKPNKKERAPQPFNNPFTKFFRD